MSTLTVAADEVDRLTRGGVCAKTGGIATQVVGMRVVHTPGWIWLLLLFGIVPFLIAYAFSNQAVHIEVPASAEVVRRRSQATARMVAAALVSAALLVAAAFVGEPGIAWIGAAGLVAVTMALPFWARTWITAAYNGEVVTLSRVHPSYVAAIGSRR